MAQPHEPVPAVLQSTVHVRFLATLRPPACLGMDPARHPNAHFYSLRLLFVIIPPTSRMGALRHTSPYTACHAVASISLCYAVLCCAMLMLCCAMLCCAMLLCYAMLCCAIPLPAVLTMLNAVPVPPSTRLCSKSCLHPSRVLSAARLYPLHCFAITIRLFEAGIYFS